jgi:beta-glucosidase
MAVGFIRGVQGAGVIATAKHYAANNQETGRLTVDVVAGERTLREIYLPHFEAAVRKGHVGAVMSAYNKVNGPFAGASRPLLRDVLMRSFGFRGFVLSDWFAGGETIGSANAGQSLAMPIAQYYAPSLLNAAVAAGRISRATIDDLVRRYLRTLFRFGVVDRQAYPRDGRIPIRRNGRIAREVETRGIVLLKNRRRALPLNRRRIHSIAVIGKPAAAYQRPGSLSSAGVRPYYAVTVLDGIRRRAGRRVAIRFDDGSDPERAARVAGGADVAVVAAAPSVESGEFLDRPCLALDCPPARPRQGETIRAVAAANRRTVVVLQSPGPVLMPWAREVPAIVEGWLPGEEGGAALAEVLFGDVNPSGKLPVTYPRREADTPARTPAEFPGVRRKVLYSEGVLVGYRHYDQRRIAPLFPFGHGLSYTRFRYRRLAVRRTRGGRYRVAVTVQNVGRRAGAEVAQLYLGLPDPRRGVVQPPKSLQGFERVELRPGASRRVGFSLGPRALSWWDARVHRWRVAPGCYRVLVGGSSRDIRERSTITRGRSHCRG